MKNTTDIHVHTSISPCGSLEATAPRYLAMCADEGVEIIGFSDHYWDPAAGDPVIWHTDIDLIRQTIPAGISSPKILFGCETEIVGFGKIGMTPARAKKLDYILLAGSHFHFKGTVVPRELCEIDDVRRLLINYIRGSLTIDFGIPTVIAHPFLTLGYTDRTDEIMDGISGDNFKSLFSEVARHGTYLEINASMPHHARLNSDGWSDSYTRMYTIARDCGCRFSFGSDAHNCDHQFTVHRMLGDYADYLGIPRENFLFEQ